MGNQEHTKKERKEVKRQEKLEGRVQEQQRKTVKKLVIWAVGIGAAALVLWFGIQAIAPEPLGPDYSKAMPPEGLTHVSEGTRVMYESNPPTSGNHWLDPLRDGIYETEKPDEAILHSLEHGRVWVSYRPDIGEATIQALRNAVKGEFGVILAPRSANEADIALAAWTRLDTFNLEGTGTLDTKRMKDFIQRYRNKGPEYVPQNTGKTYE